MADEKPRIFTAQATDPNVCGCWDKSPDHPNEEGEVFVSGTGTFEVAATPGVLDALAKGRIREVSGPSLPHRQPSEGPVAATTPQGRK